MTERLTKSEAIAHWKALPIAAKIKPHPINNKHIGSTYGMDGLRIEGSREFIDAILSRLSDLIAFENSDTRLGINYQKTEPKPGKDHAGEWVCYIKIHERGGQAKAINRATR